MKIGSSNDPLSDATMHYASAETEHTHQWSSWKTVSAATVFQAAQQKRTCSTCGQKETRSKGKALTPTMELNVSGTLTMQQGQKLTTLKVTGLANGDSVKSWKSSNTKIVKVSGKSDGTCTIKAQKKNGTAKITITLASGLKKTVKIKVQKSAVKTTKISGLSKKLTLTVGGKSTLSPVITPVTSQDKVTYKSSNTKVAAVTSAGVIKAKKAGTAKITVTSGTKTVTVTVTVRAKTPTAITNVPAKKTLKKGKTLTLNPKLTPSGSTAALTYSSSNTKVATVNSKGKITAKKKGTAVITVKAGSLSVKCKITVK